MNKMKRATLPQLVLRCRRRRKAVTWGVAEVCEYEPRRPDRARRHVRKLTFTRSPRHKQLQV
ncbi:unnamed protein product [Effrenium voratum]|uniref:Uncharacterized protein n=1 Tax=Effrenium voratum TaxID=2562239 RepID=A0AA36I0P8_9DINO|nr:unnamed protein product [Effrenium voratum]